MSDRIAEIKARLAANDRPEPSNPAVLARHIREQAEGTDDIVQVRAAVIRMYNIVAQMTDDKERLRAALDEMETAEAPCGHLERWWKVEPNQDAWCVMCTLEKLNDTAAVYLTMLREIEWVNVLVQNDADPDYPDWCPWCFNIREQGHARH